MELIAELAFDLPEAPESVIARIYIPQRRGGGSEWVCRCEVGAPINLLHDTIGETSLQAVAFALAKLSEGIYGSPEYREGRLGLQGYLGGYLALPATESVRDVAPFKF